MAGFQSDWKQKSLRPQSSRSRTIWLTTHSSLGPFGLAASCKANYDAAMTGNIPMTRQLEQETPVGQWGPLFTTGSSAQNQGNVRLLEKVWWLHPETESPTVWALPENTKEGATSLKYHFSGDKALVDSRPLAYMRYMDQRAEEAPIQFIITPTAKNDEHSSP